MPDISNSLDDCAGLEDVSYFEEWIDFDKRFKNKYGKGFSQKNLADFRKFYILFPDKRILQTRLQNLNCSHFRSLLRVDDENARIWYLNEAPKEGWSSRTLDRNISTQYYYRLLKAPEKEPVIREMIDKTAALQNPEEIIKSPVIAEFPGFRPEDSYLESELESSIITHIRDFLMEMGRGFSFVATSSILLRFN